VPPRAFADKYGLPFTLLSERAPRSRSATTPGNVARVFPNVKPAEHDELVLGALGQLA
jgi:peroxiredoxin